MVAGLPSEAIDHVIATGTNRVLSANYREHYGISDFEPNPLITCESEYSLTYEDALKHIDLDDIIIMLNQLIKEKTDAM